jgi:hypothetical protein
MAMKRHFFKKWKNLEPVERKTGKTVWTIREGPYHVMYTLGFILSAMKDF